MIVYALYRVKPPESNYFLSSKWKCAKISTPSYMELKDGAFAICENHHTYAAWRPAAPAICRRPPERWGSRSAARLPRGRDVGSRFQMTQHQRVYVGDGVLAEDAIHMAVIGNHVPAI